MGLQVGDRVKAPQGTIYEVVSEKVDSNNVIGLINKGKYEDNYYPLKLLIDVDFDLLPSPKRVGDLKCEDCNCQTCPLRFLCDWGFSVEPTLTLFENLGNIEGFNDQEIYNILKARLDKEVQE